MHRLTWDDILKASGINFFCLPSTVWYVLTIGANLEPQKSVQFWANILLFSKYVSMYFPIFRTQSQKCSHIAHIIARTRHNHLEFIKLEAYFPEVPLQQPLRPGGEFLKKEKFYLSFPQKSAMQLFCPPQYTKNCCVHSLAFVELLRMLQSFHNIL